jgi:LPXTG-motif cell wall-anchored protein
LPRTGFEIPLIVVLGAAAISAGALIRRRTH